jgi:hypothetical protein
VRLGAVTHSVNVERRYLPLSFTSCGGVLNATGPANGVGVRHWGRKCGSGSPVFKRESTNP